MPKKLYIIKLTTEEQKELNHLISNGKRSAKMLIHARILLKADEGFKDKDISDHVGISVKTIERVRKLFVEEGIERALNNKKPTGRQFRKLDGEQEAHLVALACSPAPKGYARWTLSLLADKVVELNIVDSISHETVRQTLKKMNLNLGSKSNG